MQCCQKFKIFWASAPLRSFWPEEVIEMMHFSTSCVLILLVGLVSASRYHTPVDCPLEHMNNDPRRGFIREQEVNDEFECMNACDEDEECEAYNIELTDLICEFNNDRTNKYADDMVTKDGWTYWQKEDEDHHLESDTCESNPLAGRKQREITSRGVHTLVVGRGGRYAWWGQDCKRADDERVYYVGDYSNRNDFYIYDDETAFKNNNNYLYNVLDGRYNGYADGSGMIVYDGKYWFREHNWRRLIIWDIDRWQIEASINFESIESAGYGPYSSTCQYDWGGSSSMDLEADESGKIYMTYGDNRLDCFLRIAWIDPIEYKIVRTWSVNGIPRSWGGSGFIIDQIYYMTDNYHTNPTYILAEYNFRNSSAFYRQPTSGVQLSLQWPQPNNYNSHIHWNPARQLLYASHNAQHYTSNPTFIEIP